MPASVVINPEENAEDQAAHQQAMVDKAEGKPAASEGDAAASSEDRPEWLPEGFNTPEELAKAYAEMKESGEKTESENTEGNDSLEIDEESTDDTTTDEAKEAAENAGLDFEVLSKEFMDNGELTAESYEALEKSGIPRNIVDSYIEGQKLKATNIRNETFDKVGGEEKFNTMRDWAAQNFSAEEKAAFNKAINGSAAERSMALDTLSSRYTNVNGNEPDLVTGDSVTKNTGAKYTSRQQLVADMSTKEYQFDPAFRAEVQSKLARSNIF